MSRFICHDNRALVNRLAVYGLLGLLVLLFIAIMMLASVPPVSRDALTHHLFVPKLYIEHGGVFEIPTIPFSYYPMNLDLLYTGALYLGSDILPKYIHFLFAPLTGWLVFGYLKQRISPLYGLIGALFFLSIPIIVKLSITLYVDLGLMFFTTAALLLLLRWIHSGYLLRYLVLAGICCGLAAGVKYNGLISLFLLPLFVPVIYIRSQKGKKGSSSKGIGYSFLFTIMAILVFSPWLVRNYTWTGNPIYPLHDTLIQEVLTTEKKIEQNPSSKNESTALLKKVTSRGSGVFASRKILYGETWWQSMLLPVRFFFEGQDDDPRYFDGKLTPFLLILPLFAFRKKSSTHHLQLEKYTLLAFATLFFFFTFFQEALRIRYIVSVVPALVILSVFGLHNIIAAVSKFNFSKYINGFLVAAMVCGMLLYNAGYIKQQFNSVEPLHYINGKVTRDQYITKYRPEYPVIQFANSKVEKGNKVLCLFLGKRGYYMDFVPIFDNPYQRGLLRQMFSDKVTAIELHDQLRKREIKHILLRFDLTNTWLQSLSKENKDAFLYFFQNHTVKLLENERYALFAVSD